MDINFLTSYMIPVIMGICLCAGYIVDVYDGCIVLNGRDFIDNDADGHTIAIGTYKIDTTPVEIPAGTFTDSTGIISV